MLPLTVFAIAITLSQARPGTIGTERRASFVKSGTPYVIGGTDAVPGEFPWQLSQERLSGSTGTWSHSCGASILSTKYGLSAAHCVDGEAVSNIRVIAGLHDRTDLSNAQISNIASYVMHENYSFEFATYSDDIAILVFATELLLDGNARWALLPINDVNQYVNLTCVISGWGRTGPSNNLPNVLQKAPVSVISTSECQQRMSDVAGVIVWAKHICIYDPTQTAGACNGDSGGPLNCPDGGTRVAGITSWIIVNSQSNCLPSYPSVYTRTSAYLDWITANTP